MLNRSNFERLQFCQLHTLLKGFRRKQVNHFASSLLVYYMSNMGLSSISSSSHGVGKGSNELSDFCWGRKGVTKFVEKRCTLHFINHGFFHYYFH